MSSRRKKGRPQTLIFIGSFISIAAGIIWWLVSSYETIWKKDSSPQPEMLEELILGAVGLFFGISVSMMLQMWSHALEASEKAEEVADASLIAAEVSKDQWLSEQVLKLVYICQYHSQNGEEKRHQKKYDMEEIQKRLDHRKDGLGTGMIEYPLETERMTRLRSVLFNSEKYFYAVTFVMEEYLERFFAGQFWEDYEDAHIHAIRENGAEVKRIFVVPPDLAPDKRLQLAKTLEDHRTIYRSLKTKEQKSRFEVHCVALPDDYLNNQVFKSFAVCDDQVYSVSYDLYLTPNNNSKRLAGYVAFNHQGRIGLFKDDFRKLLKANKIQL
ncbi:hypothetical protein C5Y96_26940 [Blastopirellula marina]|uniref:Uncharacterized protein n=1 Tax=Blastopirellula marina TaxID=124 RepID=A0A2S8EZ09_9BACT|nr:MULTISPECIES: hypothetical protein [Pirellulaceae]PQO25138.1 hypothetical protein C5Y96_26940 [Blastopirellula marina]RCS40989.1 hypothetical protein DTL36_26985 [Bremerella cremea]